MGPKQSKNFIASQPSASNQPSRSSRFSRSRGGIAYTGQGLQDGQAAAENPGGGEGPKPEGPQRSQRSVTTGMTNASTKTQTSSGERELKDDGKLKNSEETGYGNMKWEPGESLLRIPGMPDRKLKNYDTPGMELVEIEGAEWLVAPEHWQWETDDEMDLAVGGVAAFDYLFHERQLVGATSSNVQTQTKK